MVILSIWNMAIMGATIFGAHSMVGAYNEIVVQISAVVLIGTVIFFLAVAMSQNVRALVVEPDRTENFRSKEFYFMAGLAALIAVAII